MSQEIKNDWFQEARDKEFANFVRLARRADEFRARNEGMIRAVSAIGKIFNASPSIGSSYLWLHVYNATKSKVTKLLEAFEQLGLPIDNWKTDETPEAKNRTYKQTFKEIDFTLNCYFSGDKCRLVETGEETITKKTYKLECDEGDEDDAL